jgi:hypothetical protein
MTRERLVRAALRAWPAAVRAERGAEIADTLLEASDSRSRFARELTVLAWRGLGARAGAPSIASATLLDGVRLAGGLSAVVLLAGLVHVVPFAHASQLDGQMALAAACSALAIAGRDRWAGMGLVAIGLWRGAATPLVGVGWFVVSYEIALGLVMIASARPPRPRREPLLAAAVLIPLAAIRGPGPLEEGVAVLALASLFTLARDPRPAIACAVIALAAGVGMAAVSQDPGLAAILLTLAPLTLVAAALRARAGARAVARSPSRRR